MFICNMIHNSTLFDLGSIRVVIYPVLLPFKIFLICFCRYALKCNKNTPFFSIKLYSNYNSTI